jgi:hypothetical protein
MVLLFFLIYACQKPVEQSTTKVPSHSLKTVTIQDIVGNPNKFVDVTVLSTGPFVRGRIIDLSRSAFSSIASPEAGVIAVKVEKLK